MNIPFAYDHFSEGESPDPPFICYLLPESDNFSADGLVYHRLQTVHIELYTDRKDAVSMHRVKVGSVEWTYEDDETGDPYLYA